MPVFDILTATGAVFCAAIALGARDRVAAIAGFLLMGLVVALAWVRLGAPDVALAEAAIGAGLTGALLLRGAARIGPLEPAAPPARALRASAALLALGLAGLLGWAFAGAGGASVYPALVRASLAESGVGNPVTAVLLNFRAWDTLLEVVVLAVALLLVAALAPPRIDPAPLGEMVLPFARVVVPVAVLLAGHLLWLGAEAPGGAFQAGAVLAGGAVALGLCGVLRPAERTGAALRIAGLAGPALFVLAAIATAALTGGLLDYPAAAAKTWILVIESALTLSIAATLFLLFLGSEGKSR
ncbi:hydrogen gas-evolving membrane-bound hydrogenase subunit E [Roseivivax isoporae]|uniref:Sodium:proton antiporter n=1 Tax=Roseivivax isoporae LMG 25204 TaxID=1449351 RepID=X7F953_9RHOB|nr:hydrogen gas-evolving membrane-bound hydrogenase subunit E [Roseivivax isoporae]ETX28621.1 hypothetical protein RISW2_05875 [Roseivivax isoporae LMG 25204]